jgi:hypothetical protein
VVLVLIGTAAFVSTTKAPTLSHKEAALQTIESPKPTSKPVTKVADNVTLKQALNLVATKYGQDYQQMADVIQCESTWRTNVYSWTGSSYGIAQFTQPTFQDYCTGSYKDPFAQLDCMGKMWQLGLQRRWDCYRNLFDK